MAMSRIMIAATKALVRQWGSNEQTSRESAYCWQLMNAASKALVRQWGSGGGESPAACRAIPPAEDWASGESPAACRAIPPAW